MTDVGREQDVKLMWTAVINVITLCDWVMRLNAQEGSDSPYVTRVATACSVSCYCIDPTYDEG